MPERRSARTTRVRTDAAHPNGRLTEAEQRDRVARALATIRGGRRASPRDRLAAARWLLAVGYGPPPEADRL